MFGPRDGGWGMRQIPPPPPPHPPLWTSLRRLRAAVHQWTFPRARGGVGADVRGRVPPDPPPTYANGGTGSVAPPGQRAGTGVAKARGAIDGNEGVADGECDGYSKGSEGNAPPPPPRALPRFSGALRGAALPVSPTGLGDEGTRRHVHCHAQALNFSFMIVIVTFFGLLLLLLLLFTVICYYYFCCFSC